MDKQFNVTLTEKQLTRLVAMAKKGTISKSDNELIEFLECKLKYGGIKSSGMDWILTSQLDEIPF